jgi:hypothetical protein
MPAVVEAATVEGVAAAAAVAVGVDPPVTPAGVAGLRGEAPPAAPVFVPTMPLLRGVEPAGPAAANGVRGVLPLLVMGDKADVICSLLSALCSDCGCVSPTGLLAEKNTELWRQHERCTALCHALLPLFPPSPVPPPFSAQAKQSRALCFAASSLPGGNLDSNGLSDAPAPAAPAGRSVCRCTDVCHGPHLCDWTVGGGGVLQWRRLHQGQGLGRLRAASALTPCIHP